MMNSKILASVVFVSCTWIPFAPGQSEHWRDSAPGKYAHVTLDIDGDSRLDWARVVTTADSNNSAVQVCRSVEGHEEAGPNCVVFSDHGVTPSAMGVSVLPPGCYSFSSYSYPDGRIGQETEDEVCTRYPGVEYFRFGSHASFVVYGSSYGEWVRFWF